MKVFLATRENHKRRRPGLTSALSVDINGTSSARRPERSMCKLVWIRQIEPRLHVASPSSTPAATRTSRIPVFKAEPVLARLWHWSFTDVQWHLIPSQTIYNERRTERALEVIT
jgi:hypothetical protein